MVGLAVGAARRVPRRAERRALDRASGCARACAACAGHPAVLCYAVGNEIPAPIVRWHGRAADRALPRAALPRGQGGGPRRASSPTSTIPRPSTSSCRSSTSSASTSSSRPRQSFEAYLARLQNLAGDRPLVMTETRARQPPQRRGGAGATRSDWQVRTAFAPGCAGAFVFAWTDEWHRGGCRDRGLGLRPRRPRAREPKPALAAVADAFAEAAVLRRRAPGRASRSSSARHNGAATIAECLDGLARPRLSGLRDDRRRRRLDRRAPRRSPREFGVS